MIRRESFRQILFVIGLLLAVFLLFQGIRFGRLLPGFAGETFSRLFGILTTPFLMEAGIAAFGLVAVILVNHWRRLREGDEFVSLDRFEPPSPPSSHKKKPATEESPPQA